MVGKPKYGYRSIKWLFGKEMEIPAEWEVRKFGDIFAFLKTGTNPRNDLNENGSILYIHYGDIHSKWNLTLDCKTANIPFVESDKIRNPSFLKDGDLIIADASEDHEGSGTSILLKNVGDKRVIAGLHTIALRDTNQSTKPKFRAYLTSIKAVKTQLTAYVTGISVFGLSKVNLKGVKIPIPPLEEQGRIASILSGVDALIERTQEATGRAERLKRGLMRELLTRGIGHKRFKKVKWLFGKYVEIPEEWRLLHVKDITKINPEQIKEDYEFKKIEYIDISSIMNFQITKLEKFKINERPSRAQRIVRKDDIIISTVRPYLKAISLIIIDKFNLVCSTGFAVIRSKSEFDIRFLFNYFQSHYFYENYIGKMEGMAYPAITSNVVANSLIPIPKNDKESKQIASILSGIDAYIQKNQEYVKKLERLKKGLMQKLLTGKIRVKADKPDLRTHL